MGKQRFAPGLRAALKGFCVCVFTAMPLTARAYDVVPTYPLYQNYLTQPANAQDDTYGLNRIEGISYTGESDQDMLKVYVPSGVVPDIQRHGMTNRVVVTFPRSAAAGSLLNLVENKRGCCVERFEVQTLRRAATDYGLGSSKRLESSESDTVLIAYVESDVEYDYALNADRTLQLRFHRETPNPLRQRPVPSPVNNLNSFTFDGDTNTVKVTFQFSQSVVPSVFEEIKPHRLVAFFPGGLTTLQALNEVRRYMEMPSLFRMELFDIGSQPSTYDSMKPDREYHFTGFPSPLAYDPVFTQTFGFQRQGTIAVFYPQPDVTFALGANNMQTYSITFNRPAKYDPSDACRLSPPKPAVFLPPPSESQPFPMQDEEGRPIDF